MARVATILIHYSASPILLKEAYHNGSATNNNPSAADRQTTLPPELMTHFGSLFRPYSLSL